MIVGSSNAIAIVALIVLKYLLSVFQPIRSKTTTKTNPTRAIFESRALRKLQVIVMNSDWFIALFSPVVIGPSSFFELVGFTVVT